MEAFFGFIFMLVMLLVMAATTLAPFVAFGAILYFVLKRARAHHAATTHHVPAQARHVRCDHCGSRVARKLNCPNCGAPLA